MAATVTISRVLLDCGGNTKINTRGCVVFPDHSLSSNVRSGVGEVRTLCCSAPATCKQHRHVVCVHGGVGGEERGKTANIDTLTQQILVLGNNSRKHKPTALKKVCL